MLGSHLLSNTNLCFAIVTFLLSVIKNWTRWNLKGRNLFWLRVENDHYKVGRACYRGNWELGLLTPQLTGSRELRLDPDLSIDLAITVKHHPSFTNSTFSPAKCFLLHVLQPPQTTLPDNDQMRESGKDFLHSANNSHWHEEIGDNS